MNQWLALPSVFSAEPGYHLWGLEWLTSDSWSRCLDSASGQAMNTFVQSLLSSSFTIILLYIYETYSADEKTNKPGELLLLWQDVWKNCKHVVCQHEFVMVWWTAWTSQMKLLVATVQIITYTVGQGSFASRWTGAVMERKIVLMAVMKRDAVSINWAL